MKIHFIGIGGIGVSALAGYYLSKGHQVFGSDLSESAVTQDLSGKGAGIMIGPHKASNLKSDAVLVVHTAAATSNNPELKKAKKLKIKTQTYAEALGDLTKQMFTIAVSGMHGKSTTTAMLALVLEKAGLDPTVIVGTKLREWGEKSKSKKEQVHCKQQQKSKMSDGRNFRVGTGKYLVIEADEYNASFLNYWPKIIVLTNIEEEHLDFYRDLKHIMATFRKYVKHLGRNGILVANGQDENVVKLLNFQFPISNFQTNFKFQITNFKQNVRFYSAEQRLLSTPKLSLKVPGKHNISNAMAVLAVAKVLGVPEKSALKTLNNFSGTWRRMEYRGEVNGAKIYDDYGHHPTEIKATLQGVRELLWNSGAKLRVSAKLRFATTGKLYCVFQPHQYQRTYKLFDQFFGAFNDADKTIILPIFSVAGREKESIKKKVNSEMLVSAIQKSKYKVQKDNAKFKIINSEVMYLSSFNKVKNYLEKNLKKGDVVVVMGAGDVNKLTEMLLE